MTQEVRPKLSPVRGLFFDLGDTLYTYRDVPPSWDEHCRPALIAAVSSCDLILNEASIDRAVGLLGEFNTRTNPREIEYRSEYIFRKLLGALNIPERYLEKIVYQFFSYFRQRLHVYPDAIRILHAADERGIVTAALTDVPYGMPREFVVRDLEVSGLTPLIGHMLTSADVGYRKPRPEGYAGLCDLTGLSPDACCYAGNEHKDIQGALAAGMRAILVWRHVSAPPTWGQSATVRSLEEILFKSDVSGRPS
jgi:putative hydrolase of the HAD superfamily